MFCCKHNMVNNQYTKSVEPKHKAKNLQKLTKPKMQQLQIANIEQKIARVENAEITCPF